MDRFMYVAMTHAKNQMTSQAVRANNLANANTVGFKADFAQFREMPISGTGLNTRSYALTERPGFKLEPGAFDFTGRDLDVAIADQGWFVVDTPMGEALTRDGQFQTDQDGNLINSGGFPVIGEGGPIVLPPHSSVQVTAEGDIQVFGGGNLPGFGVVVDRLKLVNPERGDVFKDKDGMVRPKNGQPLPADETVRVQSQGLERSNVNAASEMVGIIEAARGYELSVKILSEAQRMDEAANSLVRAV